ncbi:MAG: ABC transporter ATP-binding protein/permease [Rhodocyclaceae bacterium]|jgi:putative ATP-binding cassette transporter|nr:ABC transporter ATP-binding protein/permease [Rhodocyclaceae bacterium]
MPPTPTPAPLPAPRLLAAWRLAAPFWHAPGERGPALALLAAVVALSLASVWLNVQFNAWNNRFYTALQARDLATFWHELGYFSLLAGAFIVAAVYQLYLNQLLQLRWRRWMTDHLTRRWLVDGQQYRLRFAAAGAPDNPDQRIAEDVRLFVESTLGLSLGLLSAVVTLASFAGILWSLSGDFTFEVAGQSWQIPGFMLWAALAYSVAGSWLMHRLGRPLTVLNREQQRREADYRFGLMRAREHAEAIALSRDEARERARLDGLFQHVLGNWRALIGQVKRLTWFSSGFAQLAVIFPFLAAAPRYFSGGIELGGLMQTASAFGQVQESTSWFVSAYTSLAEWFATIDRLAGFETALESTRQAHAGNPIRRHPGAADRLHIPALETRLPDGSPLSSLTDFELPAGEHLLVAGPSGVGKSTLLRAMAGLWSHGQGDIHLPPADHLLFLPQKPYLPSGPLADLLLPEPSGSAEDLAATRQALADVGLGPLAEGLHETRDWSQELSPGEQQRLALARALLARPQWLFLDEATSALDEASEARLYRLLAERLPDTTLVSVAHRSSLQCHHPRRMELTPLGA